MHHRSPAAGDEPPPRPRHHLTSPLLQTAALGSTHQSAMAAASSRNAGERCRGEDDSTTKQAPGDIP